MPDKDTMYVRGDVKLQELPTVNNFCKVWLMGFQNSYKQNIIQHLEYHTLVSTLMIIMPVYPTYCSTYTYQLSLIENKFH